MSEPNNCDGCKKDINNIQILEDKEDHVLHDGIHGTHHVHEDHIEHVKNFEDELKKHPEYEKMRKLLDNN